MEQLFRCSRSAHMFWCVAGADVGQLSQIWSDVIRCSPMWYDAVISHTGNTAPSSPAYSMKLHPGSLILLGCTLQLGKL